MDSITCPSFPDEKTSVKRQGTVHASAFEEQLKLGRPIVVAILESVAPIVNGRAPINAHCPVALPHDLLYKRVCARAIAGRRRDGAAEA